MRHGWNGRNGWNGLLARRLARGALPARTRRGATGRRAAVVAVALLSAGVVVGTAGSAAAQQPGLDLPPHPGVFTSANVAVYAEPVDGWGCHWFGDCRTEQRTPEDPEPIWSSSAAQEQVEIDCRFGNYYKITQGERGGWVVSSAIASDYRQQVCDLFQWWP